MKWVVNKGATALSFGSDYIDFFSRRRRCRKALAYHFPPGGTLSQKVVDVAPDRRVDYERMKEEGLDGAN